MRTCIRLGLSLVLLASVAGSAGAGAVEKKIASNMAAAQRDASTWKDTKASLKGLSKRTQLRAALGARDEHIVLGTREGAYRAATTVYSKALHLGLSEFSAYLPTKVEWRDKLVMGPRGLEIHTLRRVARPKQAIIDHVVADLDAQFAKKPDRIKMPCVEVEHEAFGDFHLVERQRVKKTLLTRSPKLDAATWGHVTPASIDQAVESWAAK